MTNQDTVENVLTACAQFCAFPERFRTLTVFDCSNGQFLLMDEGGLVWEGELEYATMAAAFQALEDGLAAYVEEQGSELSSCSLRNFPTKPCRAARLLS